MSKLDWGLLGFVAITAFGGYRRGLIGTALSLAGLIVGAILGARLAPQFLSGGSHSEYTGLIGLVGAGIGVMVGRLVATVLSKFIRGGLHLLPPLHLLDSLGGLAVGAAWGLALVWVAGAFALQIHGQPKFHRDVKQSSVLHHLNRIAPPHDVLRIQAAVGWLPSV